LVIIWLDTKGLLIQTKKGKVYWTPGFKAIWRAKEGRNFKPLDWGFLTWWIGLDWKFLGFPGLITGLGLKKDLF